MITPNSSTLGSQRINLDDDELTYFNNELNPNNDLDTLLRDGKISINGNELWFFLDDADTANILSNYFMADFDDDGRFIDVINDNEEDTINDEWYDDALYRFETDEENPDDIFTDANEIRDGDFYNE